MSVTFQKKSGKTFWAWTLINPYSGGGALRQIASTLVEARKYPEALQAAREISHDTTRASKLKEVAAAQARAGNSAAAGDILAEAVAAAEECTQKEIRAQSLAEIAVVQAQAGDAAASRDTLAKALAIEELQEGFLVNIAAAQARTGQFAEALATAGRIPKESYKADAVREIAIAQAQAGHFSEALAIAGQLSEEWERATALNEIAAAQAGAGQFRDALATTRQIADKALCTDALMQIAASQAQAGDAIDAQETFAEAVAAALQTADTADALEKIAVAQARAAFGAQALRTASLILTSRDSRLPHIAAALADVGDKENFKGLLIPSAYYLKAACEMCVLLADVYPEQATAIARATAAPANVDVGKEDAPKIISRKTAKEPASKLNVTVPRQAAPPLPRILTIPLMLVAVAGCLYTGYWMGMYTFEAALAKAKWSRAGAYASFAIGFVLGAVSSAMIVGWWRQCSRSQSNDIGSVLVGDEFH